MSKIVRGQSNEIKVIRMGERQTVAQEFGGRSFKMAAVEGIFSADDIEAATKAGYLKGKEDVQKEIEARLMTPIREGLQNIENILDELSRYRRELFKDSQEDAIETVKLIANRLLGRELTVSPDALKEVVMKALETMGRHKKIAFVCHPMDFQFFSTAKSDFLEKFKSVEEITVSQDRQVAKGSVLLKTLSVELNIQMDAMVGKLIDELKSDLKSNAATTTEGEDN